MRVGKSVYDFVGGVYDFVETEIFAFDAGIIGAHMDLLKPARLFPGYWTGWLV
jgi:hypothetical protein